MWNRHLFGTVSLHQLICLSVEKQYLMIDSIILQWRKDHYDTICRKYVEHFAVNYKICCILKIFYLYPETVTKNVSYTKHLIDRGFDHSILVQTSFTINIHAIMSHIECINIWQCRNKYRYGKSNREHSK